MVKYLFSRYRFIYTKNEQIALILLTLSVLIILIITLWLLYLEIKHRKKKKEILKILESQNNIYKEIRERYSQLKSMVAYLKNPRNNIVNDEVLEQINSMFETYSKKNNHNIILLNLIIDDKRLNQTDIVKELLIIIRNDCKEIEMFKTYYNLLIKNLYLQDVRFPEHNKKYIQEEQD